MAKRQLVIEYDEDSLFQRTLEAVQKHLGHQGNPARAMIDATANYAVQNKIFPTK